MTHLKLFVYGYIYVCIIFYKTKETNEIDMNGKVFKDSGFE